MKPKRLRCRGYNNKHEVTVSSVTECLWTWNSAKTKKRCSKWVFFSLSGGQNEDLVRVAWIQNETVRSVFHCQIAEWLFGVRVCVCGSLWNSAQTMWSITIIQLWMSLSGTLASNTSWQRKRSIKTKKKRFKVSDLRPKWRFTACCVDTE